MPNLTIPDRVAGALYPSLAFSWVHEDGTPQDLTDATITGTIGLWRGGGTVRAITGDLVMTDGLNGEFRWDLHADDVVAGYWTVEIVATYPSGPTPAKSFSSYWRVRPSLTATPEIMAGMLDFSQPGNTLLGYQ